jgi:hypothetical protein
LLGPTSILDYGCGQSRLLEALALGHSVELMRYDPAIPAYAKKPEKPADLLINIDVLEHVEEKDLDEVLSEMSSLCRHAIIIVDTKPAAAILPNGANAHATVRSHAWWRQRLTPFFPVLLPIAVARRSRAGFKTWPRKSNQFLQYAGLRTVETARHYGARIFAKMSGH